MADWIQTHRYRLAVLLVLYFATHVAMRICRGGGLSYDETEQVFLSQWIQWGYNSQPPLYTWIQSSLFGILGYNVFALSVLKNSLIALTYLFAYGVVARVAKNRRQAIAATLGMLMIPQIAWESHRDLSHTVLVTLATAVLMYCVVSAMKQRTTVWYVAIGIASAFGMMSKYNFAIVLIAVALSAWTIPRYRACLMDSRMIIAILVALALVAPHAIWIVDHVHLASAKTIGTLTIERTDSYALNLIAGLKSLSNAILSCVMLVFAVFAIAYRERFLGGFSGAATTKLRGDENEDDENEDIAATTLLIERYFLASLMMLVLLVLSGYGLDFENRWIQPFACLLPAYLVLRLRVLDQSRPHFNESLALNRIALMGILGMASVLIALTVRNFTKPASPAFLQSSDVTISPENDSVIIVENFRIAGEIKLIDPHRLVQSRDHQHLGDSKLFKKTSDLTSISSTQAAQMSVGHRATTTKR